MKRVYIQIIDPLNGTCMNACHEYPSEYHQAMDEVLRQYVGINVGYTLKRVDVETTFPGMPHHSRYCGAVSGTSKLINITIIG